MGRPSHRLGIPDGRFMIRICHGIAILELHLVSLGIPQFGCSFPKMNQFLTNLLNLYGPSYRETSRILQKLGLFWTRKLTFTPML